MFQEKNSFIKAKKKYGQNFLNDRNIIEKIISVIDPKDKKILEIGPGMGAITKFLAPQAKKFIAFEIDPDMSDYLISNKILESEQIVLEDFLKVELDKFKDFEVVGNIPYYITSDIIFKLIDYRHLFKSAILMVQDEVADRLIAKVNSSNYSKLSITTQYVAKVEKLFKVKKNLFVPIPKVDSAIIKLSFYQNKNDNFEELKDFFKLCFMARRKKLNFALKTKYESIKIEKAYKIMQLDEMTRIQELDLNTIVKLFYTLEKEAGN
ncbi:16S rRNA (adenine(1518)-N(6)/adenine(1519)-N(6))-dimethyltransferase RsmA [Mycoplasmopsis columbina]|uniref:Ribosomal RNA small subunit methyltransferase A n=1 Tax=Mycoplasmopsis columbina SF7 TaxID=1037410 RepID=F9UJ36_9BACT|nr:16S rRNA (adenine(1518)-N(6)/adenine(1519)-N(6))-dimethyltransferase RsmA [Mycoplasmopsis columbina]EGV00599.1 dimethyladenosine transferase rRNA modification enzyme [Mycoplasmopsis columbina SF7]VEU76670.1 dimethyladenosine transferase rRNA modification enzyme [Mycoplasmopsis columbina]